MHRRAGVGIAFLAAAGACAVAAAPAAAIPLIDGHFAGVTSEAHEAVLDVAGGGTTVTGFAFASKCSPDVFTTTAVPGSMKIQTMTIPPKPKKGKKKKKPKPLAQPIFSYKAGGFTISGAFTSPAHVEGTARWVSPAGCDTGPLTYSADAVVAPH